LGASIPIDHALPFLLVPDGYEVTADLHKKILYFLFFQSAGDLINTVPFGYCGQIYRN
jgi:hypothetical protein